MVYFASGHTVTHSHTHRVSLNVNFTKGSQWHVHFTHLAFIYSNAYMSISLCLDVGWPSLKTVILQYNLSMLILLVCEGRVLGRRLEG